MHKKSKYYFVFKDVINSLPEKTGLNLMDALNSHEVSRGWIIHVFEEETQKKNPEYKVLTGCLTLLIFQLKSGRDFYNSLSVVGGIVKSLDGERKTVRRTAAEVLIRLFLEIYHECLTLPGAPNDCEDVVDTFLSGVAKEDVEKAVVILDIFSTSTNLLKSKFIFEEHGMRYDISNPDKTREIFDKKMDKIFKDNK